VGVDRRVLQLTTWTICENLYPSYVKPFEPIAKRAESKAHLSLGGAGQVMRCSATGGPGASSGTVERWEGIVPGGEIDVIV
jgi:hypothetical protein